MKIEIQIPSFRIDNYTSNDPVGLKFVGNHLATEGVGITWHRGKFRRLNNYMLEKENWCQKDGV